MFQIPEFEPSEQEDSSSADRGLGPNPAGDQPPAPGKHRKKAPGLPGDASHRQEQPTSSSHHEGAVAAETRSRHSSYPAGNEEDEGLEEEPSPFRGRSRSAPPNLWAAQRYGRELRRMSDEFEDSFKFQDQPHAPPSICSFQVSGHAEIWSPDPPPDLGLWRFHGVLLSYPALHTSLLGANRHPAP
ncbi:bcl2-associated agonist of cell death isoform X2 [Tupaia chinensis]|uniref:bcl2-associated agonist of cell death isoform X2 n=1 Tax=Tupaia chinensis TaxID=246437 RepID=UPI0003C8E714|nr:bcl2-associated agonist of cell death isoform X2 [Tupaia chinensis]